MRTLAAGGAPCVLVAHSAAVLTLVHWAARAASERTDGVVSALLVTPPALAGELPTGYPRLAELEEAGWLPVPDHPLPFATTVVLSEDDPLGPLGQVTRMATRWSAATVTASPVGHANPAAGLRDWPWVEERIERLLAA